MKLGEINLLNKMFRMRGEEKDVRYNLLVVDLYCKRKEEA